MDGTSNLSLKHIFIRSQYSIVESTKKSIGEICVFIIKFNVKARFACLMPNKSLSKDLQFMKDIILYEAFDKDISRVSIKKRCHHL